MANGEKISCPLCGSKVSPDAAVCPFCQTALGKVLTKRELDKVIEKRLMQQLQAKQSNKDLSGADIPEVSLPRFRESCPSCGVDLKGGEPNCPRCGVPLATAASITRCEKCGAPVATGATSCPECGVSFQEKVPEELAPPPRPVEPARPRTTPPARPEVVTRPSVEAASSIGRGLTNGRGAINGTGLVNGTGMVNGTGITNGTKGEARPSSSARRQRNLLTRWQFMAVLVALVVIIPTFVYISFYKDEGIYSVDGDFGEWSDVSAFGMRVLSESESLNVENWAVGIEDSEFYFYVDSQGSMMESSEVQSLFLFVDVDASQDTGYKVGGLGAEYVLEVDGWNGTVESTAIYSFASDDALDWNSFDRTGSLVVRLEADELEGVAVLPITPDSSSEFMLVTQDQLERRAVSHVVPAVGGVLVVRQELVPSVAISGIAMSSASAPLLKLTFWAEGAGGSVSSIVTELEGAESSSSPAAFSLAAGEEHSVEVSVDTSSAADGAFVSASVIPGGITSTFGSVRVIGEPARAYVHVGPSEIAIDGAFGDWAGKTMADVDDLEVLNPNIDISEAGNVNTTSDAYFFISVNGEACCGTVVPVIRGKPVPGSGGPVIPIRKTAEDITRVFVDIDRLSSSGMVMIAGEKTIGADRMIELRGLDGKIVSTSTYVYSSGAWAVAQYAVDAANDNRRMEIGVSTAGFDGSSDIDFMIEMTDWRGRKDLSELQPVLTMGIASWVVDSTTTSATATETSVQRKIFNDGTNIWSFYFSGSDTVTRYSTNGGSTWSTPTDAVPFVTSGVLKASIWYDSANSAVYATGDRSANSVDIYIQKGSVNPSGHSITWQASDTTLAVSSNPRISKHTFISMDASGYLWLMALNKAGANSYNLDVYKSNSVRDISAWTFSSSMLASAVNNPPMKGAVVPAGSGSDMWAVYIYQGDVAVRKFSSGSWSSETKIYDNPGTDITNTDLSPPCVSVDSGGRVHVVYGDANLDGGILMPHIVYAYNTTSAGNSWATTTISSTTTTHGYKYPTVSVDSNTKNVYAFFVNMSGYEILAKKKLSTGSSWTLLSLGTQSSNDKNYLTAVYSASGETNICFQWTETVGASDYDVYFERIPEFSDAVIPVFVIILVFMVSNRAKRRKEQH